MSNPVKQIVVYRVQPSKEAAFHTLKPTMIEESLRLEGLMTSVTERALDADHTYVDSMTWRSRDAAHAGNARFASLPSAPSFLGMMAGPPLVNVILEIE